MQNLPNIVRDRLKVATSASHPDADTLTAFSERVLPEAERAAVVQHLAQCGECREVVALALPETELQQPALVKTGSRWFAWPTMRWAFVAVGIAIISAGFFEYRHREVANTPTADIAFREQQQDQSYRTQAPPAITGPEPEQDRDKGTTALVAKSETQPAATGQEKAHTSALRMKQFHGPGYGLTVGGPVAPNQVLLQWQQQNANQNQVSASAPAFGRTNPQAAQAEASTPPQAPFNTQVARNQPGPSLGGTGTRTGFAVDKAKLPVPPPSPANGMLNPQSVQDGVDELSLQAAPGQIGGYVVDPSGAVVSNARITITPSQAGGNATAVTNSQGAWLIAGLPSGSYRAQAEAPGFKTSVLDLNYDASQASMFSFTLRPGDVSETVEVSSAQLQLQAEGKQVGQSEMKPAENSYATRALSMERLGSVSAARPPRWSISAAGVLQRSFDQGNTWQDVNVGGGPLVSDRRDLDISAETQSARDTKAARAKVKSAGKKDASSPVFRAVAANGSDVWAGGLNASLYHSTDSGNHWTQIVPASAGSILTGDVVGIEFPDPQHGKLSTSAAETWVTTDSGQTWQKQ